MCGLFIFVFVVCLLLLASLLNGSEILPQDWRRMITPWSPVGSSSNYSLSLILRSPSVAAAAAANAVVPSTAASLLRETTAMATSVADDVSEEPSHVVDDEQGGVDGGIDGADPNVWKRAAEFSAGQTGQTLSQVTYLNSEDSAKWAGHDPQPSLLLDPPVKRGSAVKQEASEALPKDGAKGAEETSQADVVALHGEDVKEPPQVDPQEPTADPVTHALQNATEQILSPGTELLDATAQDQNPDSLATEQPSDTVPETTQPADVEAASDQATNAASTSPWWDQNTTVEVMTTTPTTDGVPSSGVAAPDPAMDRTMATRPIGRALSHDDDVAWDAKSTKIIGTIVQDIGPYHESTSEGASSAVIASVVVICVLVSAVVASMNLFFFFLFFSFFF